MDATAALESIAKSLPNLPLEAVESMLLTFDTLIGLSSEKARPGAAKMLRDAATASTDTGLKERLLQAARSVEAGEPCARTPEGLTWREAAAASTVGAGEWTEPPVAEPVDSEESEEADGPTMVDEPPRLPELRVKHFFPGLAARVGRGITDTCGRAVVPGQLLHLLKSEQSQSGAYRLHFLECNLHIDDDATLQNAGNQWFQPVPSIECLSDLCEIVNEHLDDADDLNDEDSERLESLVDEVCQCEEWLMDDGHSGPPPVCKSGPLAAKVFGRKSDMAVWIPLLFAGLAMAKRDGRPRA